MTQKQQVMCGNQCKKKVHIKIAKAVQQLEGEEESTAMEVMQTMLEARTGSESIESPKRVEGTPPENPTCIATAAYTTPKTTSGKWGGIGAFWPDRKARDTPLTEQEEIYTRAEETDWGMRLWNTFNNLRNSSTRCELGASIVAMLPPVAVNIGIDSSATVGKGTEIIEHESKKRKQTFSMMTARCD